MEGDANATSPQIDGRKVIRCGHFLKKGGVNLPIKRFSGLRLIKV